MKTIEEVNELCLDDFVTLFGNIIEHCPVLAAAVWYHIPFRSPSHLLSVVDDVVQRLPVEGNYLKRCF